MGTGQVGPAYQSEESEGRRGERKVAALRRELEELRSRMDTFSTELVVRGEGTASQLEWRSAVEKVEARLRGVEERVESNSEQVERAVEMCRAKGEAAEEEEGSRRSSSSSATVMGIREELRRVEAKMEEREQETRKYFLLITKLRRTRRLIKVTSLI